MSDGSGFRSRSRSWVWPIAQTISPDSCQEVRSSASASLAPSSPTPLCFCATSQPPISIAGAERLVMIEKISPINPLPLSYMHQIETVPGVSDVTHANWFGGIYQEPKNFFANMAVEPESWLRLYPEFHLSEEQKKSWLADR